MFYKTNDRLVNLENVSNINIIHEQQRVVFNMNYGIEIEKKGRLKTISDYVYLDTRNQADFNNVLNELELNEYILQNYIKHDYGFINIKEISSVKFSEQKRRVIFNLNHSVTFSDYNSGKDRLTSEFSYVDFEEFKDYKAFALDVKNILIGEN